LKTNVYDLSNATNTKMLICHEKPTWAKSYNKFQDLLANL
jgi:hypothetical protein